MNHTLLRCCAALLLIGCGLFWFKPAHAQAVCTAAMTPIAFGSVNPQASQTDATGTLSYTCVNTSNNPQTIALCFNLLGQDTDPRSLADGGGDTLKFQLYTDSARSLIWGNMAYGTQAQGSVLQISAGGVGSGNTTIYARVLGGQTTASPGIYFDNFPAGQTTFTYTAHPGGGAPQSCAGAGTPGSFGGFLVTAQVTAQCTVSAGVLDFGTPGLLTTGVSGTSTISVQCAPGITYNVGLDAGQNGGGNINARRMVLGANSIGYQLYRDPGRTSVWGNTVGSDTVAGTGTGNTQALTVYGSVPVQPTPPAGTYNDTIVVTVTY